MIPTVHVSLSNKKELSVFPFYWFFFDSVLQSITEYHRVLQSTTEYYRLYNVVSNLQCIIYKTYCWVVEIIRITLKRTSVWHTVSSSNCLVNSFLSRIWKKDQLSLSNPSRQKSFRYPQSRCLEFQTAKFEVRMCKLRFLSRWSILTAITCMRSEIWN